LRKYKVNDVFLDYNNKSSITDMHKKALFLSILTPILLVFTLQNCWSQEINPDSIPFENKTISLLTVSPGTGPESLFGHNGIRVFDKLTRQDIVFNFGNFDFNTPGFLLKFLKGKLPYRLAVSRYEDFLYAYTYEKRSVYEQELLVADSIKQKILIALQINALPENREYKYDFLFDNCATRARDQFVTKIGGEYKESSLGSLTFRDQLHQYLENLPWTRFGIDLIVASPADKVADRDQQMFLPDYLQRYMADLVVLNDSTKSFAFGPVKEVLIFEDQQTPTPVYLSPMFLFSILGMVLLIMSFMKFHNFCYTLTTTIFVVLGIGSLIILFMWFGTDHLTTKTNYNLIWMSPMFLILPFISYSYGRILAIILGLCSLVCCFRVFPQQMPVLTILPLIISSLVVYLRHGKEN
jgi:hypothetical protein